MCTGGRIVNHLKIELKDYRNDVVFVGYQAEGTPGREILDHANGQGSLVRSGTRWINMAYTLKLYKLFSRDPL